MYRIVDQSVVCEAGVSSLVGGTLSTWYSSLLIASLWKWDGNKHTTYRHLAKSIYGWDYLVSFLLRQNNNNIHIRFLDWLSDFNIEGSWGYWSIAFFQQVASLGNNIAIQIAAGSSLKVFLFCHNQTDKFLIKSNNVVKFCYMLCFSINRQCTNTMIQMVA